MELLDYILHFRNVLSRVDHRRLLEICEGIEFPEYKIGYDREAMYDMRGYRSQILLSENNDELYNLVHKVMIKVMPKIYKGYSHINPANPPLFDKYSGYWLCKYPEGGYLSSHADVDADAGSVTTSYAINGNYEGGNIRFWENYNILSGENTAHVYPSNHLFKHEITPVTKGERYSVITWFSYQKGKQWLT